MADPPHLKMMDDLPTSRADGWPAHLKLMADPLHLQLPADSSTFSWWLMRPLLDDSPPPGDSWPAPPKADGWLASRPVDVLYVHLQLIADSPNLQLMADPPTSIWWLTHPPLVDPPPPLPPADGWPAHLQMMADLPHLIPVKFLFCFCRYFLVPNILKKLPYCIPSQE